MTLFSDTTTSAIEFALRGLNERQQTTAHNIANVNTPGFRSSRISFEDELAEALRTGRSIEDLAPRRIAANTPLNTRGNDVTLEEGLVIAIEPMLCVGSGQTRVASDRWTVVTADGGLAAHFEHSIAFTSDGIRILTMPNGEVPK